jgi:hypothetical protein
LSPGLSLNLRNHPELAELVGAWPTLPADVRKMISGVVRATLAAAVFREHSKNK